MSKYNLIATTTFGLEAIAKREAMRLGFENIQVLDGRVDFTTDLAGIAKANLWFRTADRILLNMGQFEAFSFEELFEQTKALPWDEIIPRDGKFTVIGKSIKSKLYSVPDCQAIVKKAVVEKLKTKYHVEWFEETGASYEIQVAILKDVVTLTIDTSGVGLHKRGYRNSAVFAPLKETLAAALVELSYYRKDKVFIDPFCGSGTIPIEAALIAKNIAPGLRRTFASEEWDMIPKKIWQQVREEAEQAIDREAQPEIYGSDIDPRGISISRENAIRAGVRDWIQFEVKDFREIVFPKDYGVLICNPPYGERLGTEAEIEELYRAMGTVFNQNKTWSIYVLTAYEYFERLYKRKADSKRKLYNGTIKTDYFQFYGEKPPKK